MIRYEVCVVESERGWGQSREYVSFDSYEEAVKYRDHVNSKNKPLGPGEIVPDWYMYAEKQITAFEAVNVR